MVLRAVVAMMAVAVVASFGAVIFSLDSLAAARRDDAAQTGTAASKSVPIMIDTVEYYNRVAGAVDDPGGVLDASCQHRRGSAARHLLRHPPRAPRDDGRRLFVDADDAVAG